MPRTIVLSITLLSLPVSAQAQSRATSFAELANLLKAGQTVSVTNDAGQTVTGQVRHVSDTMLVLRSGQHDLSLAAPDVQRIARPRHTVRNGALIGLAAGSVAGVTWAASQPCDFTCFSSPAGVLAFGGLFAAIGLGVGTVIGTLHRGEHVVFERPVTGRVQAGITPWRARRGAGLLVQIGW